MDGQCSDDPTSAEPESPSSSSNPVGPDCFYCFHTAIVMDISNHSLLDQQLDHLCSHVLVTACLWKCWDIPPGVIFIGSVQPSNNYSAPLQPDGMLLFYILFCVYTVCIFFMGKINYENI